MPFFDSQGTSFSRYFLPEGWRSAMTKYWLLLTLAKSHQADLVREAKLVRQGQNLKQTDKPANLVKRLLWFLAL